jgi:ActR/RegA family two-component response regulator
LAKAERVVAGEPDLTGHCILVAEDDYYLAFDTARALRAAGAVVIGPCATEQAALDELQTTRPTGAVVDINLGSGASFKLAAMLRQRAIPLVFVTGYDPATIPPEFHDVTRLQKPVELDRILRAIAESLSMPL